MKQRTKTKAKVTQIWKNSDSTWLSNIVSYIYQTKNYEEEIEIFFETKEWVKSLSLYWKKKDNKKWYWYIIPKEILKGNKDKEFFTTKQDLFIPEVQDTLYQMWFKETTTINKKDRRLEPEISEIFSESDSDSHFDFDSLEEKEEKKIWVLEALHLLFNSKGSEVVWPKEVVYKSMGTAKKEDYGDEIVKVHKFKGVIWTALIEKPLEILRSFQISTSSFNINVKGETPLVLEMKNWDLIESNRFKTRTLISNWIIRVKFLYAKISESTYKKLKESNYIKENEYSPKKYYKFTLWNSESEKINISSLVSSNIERIDTEEIVNLVYSVNNLKVRMSVYNSKIKEIKSLVKVYAPSEEWSMIDNKGRFTPKRSEDTESMKNLVHTKKISIWVLKFPTKEVTMKEKKLLDDYLELTFSEFENKAEILHKKELEYLDKKYWEMKKEIEEKRYKLSLISYVHFINWFSSRLNYKKWTDWKVDISKSTTAKGIVGWVKKSRVLENKEGTIRIEICLWDLEENK